MAWPLANQSAAAVTDAFVQGYVLDKGAPERLLTDQGKKFSSKLLQEVCDLLGTKKVRTSPYHPQTDGMVERLNRTLTSMLCQQVCESHVDWDLQVPGVLAAYRMAPHAATGFSPFYLMYGREADPPMETQLGLPAPRTNSKLAEHIKFNIHKLTEAREAARLNSRARQIANERLRARKVSVHNWEPGDKAWLHCPQAPLATSPKLLKPWRGPVEVVRVARPQCVQIKWGKRRWYVHPSRLKPFSPPYGLPLCHEGRACDVTSDPEGELSLPAPHMSPPDPLPGVSELTAADHRRPDLEQPEPPDGRQRPVPYDGPARRTRARSRYFV
ncbi:uncharacterized protein LOC133355245 [Lethenteron reissneri]|uniref:uncharacterized protein LOC133355245 n=1 Tax=Lethenteron reissneri TaxID=7753 RepID=UPI002AB61CE5|nr:uncharacterized protein LOC133355245 [Lethenteron reissneri]